MIFYKDEFRLRHYGKIYYITIAILCLILLIFCAYMSLYRNIQHIPEYLGPILIVSCICMYFLYRIKCLTFFSKDIHHLVILKDSFSFISEKNGETKEVTTFSKKEIEKVIASNDHSRKKIKSIRIYYADNYSVVISDYAGMDKILKEVMNGVSDSVLN